MKNVLEKPSNTFAAAPNTVEDPSGVSEGRRFAQAADVAPACFHCGEPCDWSQVSADGKAFCCQGCRVVHDLLAESGLSHFYDLNPHPGTRVPKSSPRQKWACLDEPALQQRLLDFTDGRVSRITFQVPAIHCVACVWLLENLFRLRPGIRRTQVNFAKREAAITFDPEKIALSELAALLASIGYEPALTLGELEKPKPGGESQQRALQVGIAGFAFGNIMLFSLPAYLGFDSLSGPVFKVLFAYLSLALALPVIVFSAADYWRSALLSLRQRVLTLDVPIVLGLAALYAQSAFEIVLRRGDGYLDSLSGLVFLLLCGRIFQQKTHDRMAFDRDFKSFFPLVATRKTSVGEECVSLSNLRVGDRLIVRNGELIPADSILADGPGFIDYSFVTGESEPVVKRLGDYLYAGGQQMGGAIELEIVKPVSQSYLTSLWNHEAFQKDGDPEINTLTNRYSRRFTVIVVGIAAGAALFWFASGESARALKSFTSVLIVACPCALALAAPFTLGTAQRLLARLGIFLRNALVIERMAQTEAVVFDKTGTLTASRSSTVSFHAAPSRRGRRSEEALRGDPDDHDGSLSAVERRWVSSLARHSAHPYAARIGEWLGATGALVCANRFIEIPGCGIQAVLEGHEVRLGSRAWIESCARPHDEMPSSSVACLAIDGAYRGAFLLASSTRPETDQLLQRLAGRFEIALLSGDNERDRGRFREWFKDGSRLHFNQSPLDKLAFIRSLQKSGRIVMMVGDGLNDAGALKQSDVGVAVIECVGSFSPASDVILESRQVTRLSEVLSFAQRATRIVQLSFGLSALYNAAGVSVAAAGLLSPLICAILMPLSSVSVVLFACGATQWAFRRSGLKT